MALGNYWKLWWRSKGPLHPLLLERNASSPQVWIKMDSLESRHRKSHEDGDRLAQRTIFPFFFWSYIIFILFWKVPEPWGGGWYGCSLLQEGAKPFCVLLLFSPEWDCWFAMVVFLLLQNTNEERERNRKWKNIQSDSSCSVNLWL